MKTYLLLWLMFGWTIAFAADQNDETPIVNRKPTEVEMEAGKAKYAKIQDALPLEQRDSTYLILSKAPLLLAPAFIDTGASTLYQWKNVVLQPKQIPILADGSRSGSGLILAEEPQQRGFQIKEIDPPVRYIALEDSKKYGAGYYDASHRIFYRWDNSEFDRSELPVDVEIKNLILAPSSIAYTTLISPPSKRVAKPSDAVALKTPNDRASSVSSHIPSPIPTPVASALPKEKSSPWLLIVVGVVLAALAGSGLFWLLKKPSST